MLREHAHGGSNPPTRTSRRAKSRRNKRGHSVAVSARLVVAQQVRVRVPLVTPHMTRCSGSICVCNTQSLGFNSPPRLHEKLMWVSSSGPGPTILDRRTRVRFPLPTQIPSLVDPVPRLRILVTDVQFVPREPRAAVERNSTRASEARSGWFDSITGDKRAVTAWKPDRLDTSIAEGSIPSPRTTLNT